MAYAHLKGGRSAISFSVSKASVVFTLSGGADHQPNLENHSLEAESTATPTLPQRAQGARPRRPQLLNQRS